MQAILPRKVMLSVESTDAEHVAFVYEETFAPGEEKLATNAIEVVRALIHPDAQAILVEPLTARLSGTVPITAFGDMMVGEFLSWSTLGNASMSTILRAVGIGLQGTRPGRVKLRDLIIGATSSLAEKHDNAVVDGDRP